MTAFLLADLAWHALYLVDRMLAIEVIAPGLCIEATLFFLVPKLRLENGGLLKLQLHVALLAKPELGGSAFPSRSLGTR